MTRKLLHVRIHNGTESFEVSAHTEARLEQLVRAECADRGWLVEDVERGDGVNRQELHKRLMESRPGSIEMDIFQEFEHMHDRIDMFVGDVNTRILSAAVGFMMLLGLITIIAAVLLVLMAAK